MVSLLRRKTLFYNQLKALHSSPVVFSVPTNMLKQRDQFNAVMPEVLDSLMKSPKLTTQLPDVETWLRKLLGHNLVGGKQGRGLAVPFAYQMLEKPENYTEEKMHTARFLGWVVEMLQAYVLIVDDIIDASTTRRGRPCWHLQPGVGTSATNDCVLIYQCMMEVLIMNFKKTPYYVDLIEVLNETLLYTTIGQSLDFSSGYTKEKNNLDTFTMERFNAIAVNKTAYYSFRLPLLVALFVVKDGNKQDTTESCNICWDLGKLLQFQNDYKDVYLSEGFTGKAGTDIQEGKLSWMAVRALELGNESQRAIMKEYYGSKNPEHVKRIKQLYDDLNLEQVYEKYEREVNDDLVRRINALPTKGETKFFLEILEVCRQKKF